MKEFKAFFILDLRRFAHRKITVTGSVLLLLCALLFVQIGIDKYKSLLKEKETFQQYERMKVERYTTYTQYGGYGYRILLVPADSYIFFINSGLIPDIKAFVDSGERLKIYHSLKGNNVFETRNFGFTDFSGIVLFFGSLLGVLLFFDAFTNTEFLKMLTSMAGFKKVFLSLVISRTLIILLLITVITGMAWLLVTVNGIRLTMDIHLFYSLLTMILVLLFFFALGTAAGNFQSKRTGLFVMLSCWFILLFILPAAVKFFIGWTADHITPVYKMEKQKFNMVMDCENKAIQQAGTFDYGKDVTDLDRKFIIDYYENEFKKIHALETRMRNQMKRCIALQQGISAFFPTTFYLSAANELSSTGYRSLVDYYRYVQDSKTEFFKFYMDKLYFSASNFEKVESFVKGDENIYRSPVRLPDFFMVGILSILFYIAGLFWKSYRMFKKLLFRPADEGSSGPLPGVLKLEKGDFKVVDTEGDRFKNQMFNLLSGEARALRESGFNVNVFLNGTDLAAENKRYDFLYVCHPRHLPRDIKTAYLLQFINALMNRAGSGSNTFPLKSIIKSFAHKRIKRLSKGEKGFIILSILGMKQRGIYMLDDAAGGMPIAFAVHLKDRMEKLKEKGSLVLYLTENDLVTVRKPKDESAIYDTPNWCRLVGHYKELYDIPTLEEVLLTNG